MAIFNFRKIQPLEYDILTVFCTLIYKINDNYFQNTIDKAKILWYNNTVKKIQKGTWEHDD